LSYSELYCLAFGQSLETLALDGAEVYEHVRTLLLLDETKAFGLIEELYFTFNDIRHT